MPPVLVQSTSGSGSGSSTGYALTVTLGSATTAGNCLVVKAGAWAFTTNPSISGITLGGSAGNFASLVSAGTGASAAITSIWADPPCAGGQTSVVITTTGGAGATLGAVATVEEWSGLAATIAGLTGKTATTDGALVTSTSWASGATAGTAQASEVWAGMVFAYQNASLTITGPSSPWNNLAQVTYTPGSSSYYMLLSGYEIAPSTGTANYSGTFSAAAYYDVAAVTLKAQLHAGDPPPVPPYFLTPWMFATHPRHPAIAAGTGTTSSVAGAAKPSAFFVFF